MKTAIFLFAAFICLYACESGGTGSQPNKTGTNTAPSGSDAAASSFNSDATIDQDQRAIALQTEPKNVREFFMLLPENYFTLEGCDREKDKDCKKAREEYLQEFAEVDIANGYIKGGCDGGQACIEMAIFKRPDGTYLVGVGTFAEMMNDYYFLDYRGGQWKDISSQVVPQFSKKNMYELPRNSTTVHVFAKRIIEQGADYEASEKGKKLYDLIWKEGKFTIKR